MDLSGSAMVRAGSVAVELGQKVSRFRNESEKSKIWVGFVAKANFATMTRPEMKKVGERNRSARGREGAFLCVCFRETVKRHPHSPRILSPSVTSVLAHLAVASQPWQVIALIRYLSTVSLGEKKPHDSAV